MLRNWLNRAILLLRKPAGPGHAEADRLVGEGNRAESAGKLREASDWYRRAAASAPGYAKTHLNLGIALEALGDAEGAMACFERALAIDPADAYANYNLGRLLAARRELARAERHLRSAIDRKENFPEARIVLSSVLESQGDLPAAVAELETAVRTRPDDGGAWLNLGLLLARLNRRSEAEAALGRAVSLRPDDPEPNHQLANLLWRRGELGEAERLLRGILQRNPEFADAHVGLCQIHESRGDLGAAAGELEAALRRRPDSAGVLCRYGALLRRLWRLPEAEQALRRAVALDPALVPAYRDLAAVLLMQSRVAAALEVCDDARAHYARHDGATSDQRLLLDSVELLVSNFSDELSSEELFARHRAAGARLEQAYPARFAPFRNPPDPGRRLRVGYVSGDFRYHPVAVFAIPLIERHDRSQYEIYCYSLGNTADTFTRQLSRSADAWRDASSASWTEVADAIHRDRVDLLVDLSGHSGIVGLGIFAQQPAPVQATWLGYLNTTGMTRIGYRICDACTDPPGLTDRFHTETLIRLPHSQWCYRPFVSIEGDATPPCERNGFVTFGSFNQIGKLSPSIRGLWAEILLEIPDSRLVIVGAPDPVSEGALRSDFETRGIAPSRITVVPYVGLQEYFRWYRAVDISLDTQPYSGGTTTCDALWMGVPVITMTGERSASRSAASLLTAAGLSHWIASSPENYVRLAVRCAQERHQLSDLRRSLRERVRASPLMDEEGFARGMEQAYRSMWRNWCEQAGRVVHGGL